MTKNTKAPTSYAIINGRKVAADTGRSIDGFGNTANNNLKPAPKARPKPANHLDLAAKAKSVPAKTPSAPTANRPSLDGLGRTRAPVARTPTARKLHQRHSTQSPRVAHAQRSQAQKQQSADRQRSQNATPIKPRHEPSVNHDEHKIPQSARLTQARLDRAKIHRQSPSISKFGSRHHDQAEAQWVRAQAQPPEPAPETPQGTESGVDLDHMIASLRQPISHINHEIAQYHQRHSQYARDVEVADQGQAKSESKLAQLFRSQKFIASAATVTSMAVIVGYIAYLNAPNIAMRVAANRAGVEAQMPGHVPSGFALDGPVQYSDGKVVVSFQSNSDNREFALLQEQSNWDSRSLEANLSNLASGDVRKINESGLTIFVYNGSNASWVNGGIRYTLEGSSLLSTEQIASIATSM